MVLDTGLALFIARRPDQKDGGVAEELLLLPRESARLERRRCAIDVNGAALGQGAHLLAGQIIILPKIPKHN